METTQLTVHIVATATTPSLTFHPEMPSDPDPMQGLLHLLGRCSLLTLHGIMLRQRQPIHGYHLHLTAQRAVTLPKLYTSVDLDFRFIGAHLDDAKITQAVRLFAKYCPIHQHLGASIAMTHRWSREEHNA